MDGQREHLIVRLGVCHRRQARASLTEHGTNTHVPERAKGGRVLWASSCAIAPCQGEYCHAAPRAGMQWAAPLELRCMGSMEEGPCGRTQPSVPHPCTDGTLKQVCCLGQHVCLEQIVPFGSRHRPVAAVASPGQVGSTVVRVALLLLPPSAVALDFEMRRSWYTTAHVIAITTPAKPHDAAVPPFLSADGVGDDDGVGWLVGDVTDAVAMVCLPFSILAVKTPVW